MIRGKPRSLTSTDGRHTGKCEAMETIVKNTLVLSPKFYSMQYVTCHFKIHVLVSCWTP